MGEYNFIAIGDTVTDAFIRLKEASVHCAINRENCQICMRFGDKIPYEDVFVVPAVGNSANAAVSASRLGLKSAIVTNIGDDDGGKEILETFAAEKVGADFIAIHAGAKSNYHYVLWYEDDRTILIKHQSYEYRLPSISEPSWMYLSSMGENATGIYDQLIQYLASRPGIKLAFQPGTYQIKLGWERLAAIYRRADVFFCNKDEAERILGLAAGADIKILLDGLRALGPKVVVVTDGPAGAYAAAEKEKWFMLSYPDPKPPLERTGAGDAFSSALTAALALGQPLTEALRWAPINAMSVVQQVGARAGLLTRPELEKYLAAAPPDYQPKPLP